MSARTSRPTPPARPTIGRTIAESTPSHADLPRPPEGAPNVVLIVLDDLGFGQLGCYGSDIATPAIDQLAASGLRYDRFHVTAMCSPTRAGLLTGRNHHRVGMGFLPDVPIGFPGYTGRIPPSAGTLPRILRDHGYSTFAVGKWHLTPRWDESASGPFGLWPLGLGFERYYGFLGGDTNQWTPDLVRDNSFVEPPARPEDGYHVTEDLADQAIRMVRDQQHATPAKPFFLYFATGAVHAPHQVPDAYIEPYRGRFDGGWEAWREATFRRQIEAGVVPAGTTLTPRPSWVQDWGELDASQRRLFARMMEVFAGFLTHTDAQIARIVGALEEMGVLDDTLVMVVSDNGASAEGGPVGSFNEHRFTHDMVDDVADTAARADDLGGFRSYNHYAWGWAWAGNTPFRLWKRYTWLGGTRTPLVVHWPARLGGTGAPGAVRSPFVHAVDVMPTVLDVVGIDPPSHLDGVPQLELDGASFASSFDDADAATGRSVQYFELLGSRAIYADGWKATTDHVGQQLTVEKDLVEGSHDFEGDRWSLFHLDEDFSEATDLAADEPDRLRRMVEQWWAEAGRNQVLPLDDSFIGRAVALEPRPFATRERNVYRPGGGAIAEDLLPPMGGGFVLTASLTVGAGAQGVVCALGDWSNGWALYLRDGVPTMTFNLFGRVQQVVSEAALAEGERTLTVEYRPGADDPSRALAVAIDGEPVGAGPIEGFLPFRWQIGGAGLVLGHDRGFPVCEDYEPPFPLTATLHEVTIEVGSILRPDGRAEVARAVKRE